MLIKKEKESLFFIYQNGEAIMVSREVWEKNWLDWYEQKSLKV